MSVLAFVVSPMVSLMVAMHFNPELARSEMRLRIMSAVALMLCVMGILPLQMLRMAIRVRKRVPDWRTAFSYGVLTMSGKWANFVGQVRYRRDRKAGKNTRLIEYKASARAQHA